MTIDALRKRVTVPAGPETAFRRFTEEMDTWWPRQSHSVYQEECVEVGMEGKVGGRLYEISRDGDETTWGRVTGWEPPRRVAFTWHPGRDAKTAQSVEVTFRATDDGTEVEVVHVGWERLDEAAEEMRERYDGGWERVLGRLVASLEDE